MPQAALFGVLTLAFACIAAAAAAAGEWVIASSAAVLAVWMGSFAWARLRKTRR